MRKHGIGMIIEMIDGRHATQLKVRSGWLLVFVDHR